MNDFVQINYNNIEENEEYNKIIHTVIKKCFEEEGLDKLKIYINIILTNPEEIRKINKEYRNIDKETDCLSFPMFEKEEIEELIKQKENITLDILGDVVVSIERVYEQAKEYNHSFERELAYMVVHGFYHLMGYDHMEEEDKTIMREKEENILQNLNITR
ncbi:MAG TPA: rRNA maturation RNase YbeY [Clostridiales bacterium]|nr:rRNA maturation RNase YbeY [Clostridiales bacterium]